MTDFLKLNNLSFSYSDSEFSIRNVSLSISEGKFVSVVGRNGSGKSTLIKIICRIYRNYYGEIFFHGRNLKDYEGKEISKLIAYLPQHAPVYNDVLSVRQLLMNGRYPYKDFFNFRTTKEDDEIVNFTADLTGVQDFLEKPVDRLSGGERQKVFLTLSLVQLNPMKALKGKLLVIDEPITFLDINHQLEIFALVKRLNVDNGLTVISVIHDLNYAMKFSDEVILIDSGIVVKSGKPNEVITTDSLRNYFLVNSEIHNLSGRNILNIINQYDE
ncbi:MAG: ABC transporter ATP-binding protein [Ignavibacteriaceae bacterium]|jgi:ABC-type cobalamin/Fe3+-siderophores transport systems, ATPase components|nr:MAG: ABC transporter ATP-binding protein [Chlorobiota bacterium]KXK02539.1 MAG: iron (III) ABC transporter, ATP-binding protein (hemV-1) [Chlorobi bacterium OLB4]MBV6398132.1 Ferric enterobactin transport ATP-binding protein FepC [Ignavibacteria bacterium]MCC6886581.1 ABC transporter ATP-binding protein [Ignavibacteriales bacterium]MCE7952344.1 ABC transporter ATP-binding protein [Chlorobi bacterium CHB7]MDL1886461.1 ABC transporter ATP-binding protein [Ignavibacteria bacterium CHB1]MEB232